MLQFITHTNEQYDYYTSARALSKAVAAGYNCA